jgi:uncharacterized integral membrane protein
VSSPEVQYDPANELPPNQTVGGVPGTEAAGAAPEGSDPTGRKAQIDGARHTRISGAWVAVGVAVVLGIALVDFIVQNTRDVRIEFFAASGHVPVAVALLAAALAGAFLVLAVGIARTTQLRLANRRGKKLQQQTESQIRDSQN